MNAKPFKSIAVAQHGADSQKRWVWAKDLKVNLGNVETAIEDLLPVFEVLVGALKKTKRGVAHVDFLACGLHSTCDTLIPRLETLYGVDFRASTDDTGNDLNGGDWIMETPGDGNYNVSADYLDPELVKHYKEVMGPQHDFAKMVLQQAVRRGAKRAGTAAQQTAEAAKKAAKKAGDEAAIKMINVAEVAAKAVDFVPTVRASMIEALTKPRNLKSWEDIVQGLDYNQYKSIGRQWLQEVLKKPAAPRIGYANLNVNPDKSLNFNPINSLGLALINQGINQGKSKVRHPSGNPKFTGYMAMQMILMSDFVQVQFDVATQIYEKHIDIFKEMDVDVDSDSKCLVSIYVIKGVMKAGNEVTEFVMEMTKSFREVTNQATSFWGLLTTCEESDYEDEDIRYMMDSLAMANMYNLGSYIVPSGSKYLLKKGTKAYRESLKEIGRSVDRALNHKSPPPKKGVEPDPTINIFFTEMCSKIDETVVEFCSNVADQAGDIEKQRKDRCVSIVTRMEAEDPKIEKAVKAIIGGDYKNFRDETKEKKVEILCKRIDGGVLGHTLAAGRKAGWIS